jgi:hypothetical protein
MRLQFKLVVPGLVPGIHVFSSGAGKGWMAEPSPAKTVKAGVAVDLHEWISFPDSLALTGRG